MRGRERRLCAAIFASTNAGVTPLPSDVPGGCDVQKRTTLTLLGVPAWL